MFFLFFVSLPAIDFVYKDEAQSIIQRCVSDSQSITIPSTVKEISSFAFQKSLTQSIVIDEPDQSIFFNPFSFVSNTITSIKFPSKVIFSNFSLSSIRNISEIKIPSITLLEDGFFAYSINLKKILIDDIPLFENNVLNFSETPITSIGNSCFLGIDVHQIILNKDIKKFSFAGLDKLETVEADFLTEIPSYAFSYCSSLKTVTPFLINGTLIVNSTISIGQFAFQYVPLASVKITSLVPISAFSFSPDLVSLDIITDSSSLSLSGLSSLQNLTINGTKILVQGNLTVNSLFILPNNAFSNTSIVEAHIGTEINSNLFYFSTKIQKVYFDSLSDIPSGTFSGCISLDFVQIGNKIILKNGELNLSTIKKVGTSAFSGVQIQKVFLNDNILEWNSLGEISIQKVVFYSPKIVGDSPFFNSTIICVDLNSLEINSSIFSGSNLSKVLITDFLCENDEESNSPSFSSDSLSNSLSSSSSGIAYYSYPWWVILIYWIGFIIIVAVVVIILYRKSRSQPSFLVSYWDDSSAPSGFL